MSTTLINMTAKEFMAKLQENAGEHDVAFLMHFFRTGPGEYGEGDRFVGAKVPSIRKACRLFHDMPLGEIKKLLYDSYHEHRLGAVILLVNQSKKADEMTRQSIFDMYMKALRENKVNSWDIVDASCMHIVGEHAREHGEKLLFDLAKKDHLWSKRVAMVSCFAWVRKKEIGPTIEIARLLYRDSHDLMHKAVGWLLREVGKLDEGLLTDFLDEHRHDMARTTVRYAVERLDEAKRREYPGYNKTP